MVAAGRAKAADTLAEDGHAIAFVDLEPFKGHHYPDVLLSVLIAALAKLDHCSSDCQSLD